MVIKSPTLDTSAGQKRTLVKRNGYCPVVTKAVSAMRNNESMLRRYMNISAINAVIFMVRPPTGCFSQCEEVAVEDLKIKNMVKNKHLSKSISDAGWGTFRLRLQSKAANAGLTLTKVDPKHTSQKCSGCDSVVPKSLSERVHACPHCRLVLDRDYNAAINIKKAAVALRGGVSVVNDPEPPRMGTEARNSVRPIGADKQAPSFRAG